MLRAGCLAFGLCLDANSGRKEAKSRNSFGAIVLLYIQSCYVTLCTLYHILGVVWFGRTSRYVLINIHYKYVVCTAFGMILVVLFFGNSGSLWFDSYSFYAAFSV